jgi:FixJ family two-component response regulator
MSGYHADGASGEMLRDCSFIQKPFEIQDLREAVRRAIEGAGTGE